MRPCTWRERAVGGEYCLRTLRRAVRFRDIITRGAQRGRCTGSITNCRSSPARESVCFLTLKPGDAFSRSVRLKPKTLFPAKVEASALSRKGEFGYNRSEFPGCLGKIGLDLGRDTQIADAH